MDEKIFSFPSMGIAMCKGPAPMAYLSLNRFGYLQLRVKDSTKGRFNNFYNYKNKKTMKLDRYHIISSPEVGQCQGC